MYGGLRASNMVARQNPNISSYYIENVMNEKPIDLNERNLKMAFTIESFYSPIKQKNDSRYVKWLFTMSIRKDGKDQEFVINYHKCTDEDYAEFYPVQKSSENFL